MVFEPIAFFNLRQLDSFPKRVVPEDGGFGEKGFVFRRVKDANRPFWAEYGGKVEDDGDKVGHGTVLDDDGDFTGVE